MARTINAFFAGITALGALVAADVPEPQPVKSSVEITALYYPGTEHMPEWDMVKQVVPQARPLLGWYDEGDPANVDWQIKWAVEHGISSFCVCWYWNKGEQRLDHWVKAFCRAGRDGQRAVVRGRGPAPRDRGDRLDAL